MAGSLLLQSMNVCEIKGLYLFKKISFYVQNMETQKQMFV